MQWSKLLHVELGVCEFAEVSVAQKFEISLQKYKQLHSGVTPVYVFLKGVDLTCLQAFKT